MRALGAGLIASASRRSGTQHRPRHRAQSLPEQQGMDSTFPMGSYTKFARNRTRNTAWQARRCTALPKLFSCLFSDLFHEFLQVEREPIIDKATPSYMQVSAS